MSPRFHSGPMRVFAIFALCLAFAAGGFAHRVTTPLPDADLAAYVAAGGLPSDLCGAAGDAEGAAARGCSLCVMAGLALLPARSAGLRALGTVSARLAAPRQPTLRRAARRDPSRAVRAPPLA
ncbi:hypothetical protein D6850_09245 [Roseovarius spongiae]|uniref:DUF2946 domain-containing protein n=1 Tax=Roseovarius spongiae TaxID=2320272 RepID=A0A3A8AXY9_9RHOB|nr:hypothetical protein [Roseovarius spongiae]RKF15031.1 hypothetical protein D6850_09245 [Roseovarius spongiae]